MVSSASCQSQRRGNILAGKYDSQRLFIVSSDRFLRLIESRRSTKHECRQYVSIWWDAITRSINVVDADVEDQQDSRKRCKDTSQMVPNDTAEDFLWEVISKEFLGEIVVTKQWWLEILLPTLINLSNLWWVDDCFINLGSRSLC